MRANTARKIKGNAVDCINKMGYNNVYASDSGNQIIIITDTDTKLRELPFEKINYDKNQAIITFNKINIEILHFLTHRLCVVKLKR